MAINITSIFSLIIIIDNDMRSRITKPMLIQKSSNNVLKCLQLLPTRLATKSTFGGFYITTNERFRWSKYVKFEFFYFT